ncbi:MAG: MBL fold metallo-hydrolase [Candidatus Dormibacteraeota bacterium]|nr:MBL fold metallo-hydrolase [Candidatus Dormibacteraeota bacterium]MBO0705849.1 MBL fold metallo-hydrolase [Candidatus Dormibacteraeota bacterium]MBO0760807.1 MBL fold metallo-hydrolase [Candidatus Dormibacteraeota bacterium]
MLLEQFYLESLGHASYLVGDERTRQALVFDPRRDVDVYVRGARRHGLRIAYAADSHGHNDYVSGLAELAERTGAQLWASASGTFGYEHRPLRDGDVVEMGDVGIRVLHTPGHTPEHLSLLLFDRALSAETPVALLSGGVLLVGDVGRPDLLGGAEQARRGAEALCHTLQQKVLALPDHVEVLPTHVAGSLCAANIGNRLATTIGYERAVNPTLARVNAAGGSADECLGQGELPTPPPYWRRLRDRNLGGAAPLGALAEPPPLTAGDLDELRRSGQPVLDTRSPDEFGVSHVPGALNVGLGPGFTTWAGTVLQPGTQPVLVLDGPDALWEATWQLLRIGLPPPQGWLAGGMTAWRTAHLPLGMIGQIDVDELAARLEAGAVHLLDVRQPGEWAAGHVAGARHVTGAELPDRLHEVPDGRPLAVTCSSGYRSSVAASLLARAGRSQVLNVLGGMTAWQRAGLPVARE